MKAVVRTIEGTYAVIEMGLSKHKIIIPLQFLPPGIEEGNTLKISIEIDPDYRPRKREKVTNIEQRIAQKNRPR